MKIRAYEEKNRAYDVKSRVQQSTHIEVNIRAYEVKISFYEVINIRAYEVKINFYEDKSLA